MEWHHLKESIVEALILVYDTHWKSVILMNVIILFFCIYGLVGMYLFL